MALTYTTYRLQLQTMVVSQDPDPDFDNILPGCIDYAEQRIYRELNLLNTVVTDQTVTLTLNQRSISIPQNIVAVNAVNIITPVNAGYITGSRSPLTPLSREVFDFFWPNNATSTGLPTVFAMVDQWSMMVGPSPDAAYEVEVIGTERPEPLSSVNTTTFLTDRLPDLFMAASMVFMSGYMRNFGQQASDPQMGQSWEQQYGLLKASADTEELRKQFNGASWTSKPISPIAQPQRG